RIQDGRLRLRVDLRIGEHLLDLGELLIQKLAERRHQCRITHLRADLILLVLNLGKNGRHLVAGALIGREDLLEHLGELLVGQLCGFNAAVVLLTCAGCPGIKASPTTRRRGWRGGGRRTRAAPPPPHRARGWRRWPGTRSARASCSGSALPNSRPPPCMTVTTFSPASITTLFVMSGSPTDT